MGVKKTQDSTSGNAAIVGTGAKWCSEQIVDLDIHSLLAKPSNRNVDSQQNLFSLSHADLFSQLSDLPEHENHKEILAEKFDLKSSADVNALKVTESLSIAKNKAKTVSNDSFYQLFIQNLQKVASEPISELELVEAFELHQEQVKRWLARALEQNLVTKLMEPTRYQWSGKNA